MRAVTRFAPIRSEMSVRARVSPYEKFRRSTSILRGASFAAAPATFTGEGIRIAGMSTSQCRRAPFRGNFSAVNSL